MKTLPALTQRLPLQAILALFITTISTMTYADDMLIAKQFINATTVVIAKIDSNRIGLSNELFQKIETDAQLKKGAKPIALLLKNLTDALNGESVFIAVDIPFSSGISPVRLYVRNSQKVDAKKLSSSLAMLQFTKPVIQGEFLCMSFAQPTESSSKIAIANDILPIARPDFESALQEVGNFPIQVLILPPDYIRTTFRDLLPTLPAKFGGGPTSVLTEGLKWTAIGMDPTKLKLQAVTQSRSPEAAKALAAFLPKLLASQADSMPVIKNSFEQLLPLLKPTVAGDKITISLQGETQMADGVTFVSKALQRLLGPITTQIKKERFKQIGLQFHNYESAMRVLPPGKEGRDESGKSFLSWRVHILPYLDQIELYNQFRLKEPWDSEHNLKLLERMPDVYKSGANGLEAYGDTKPGYTTFLAPVGEGTIFGGLKPCKLADILDGMSNTIWLVEVKPEFSKPWTAPADYAFDVANPVLGLAEIGVDKPTFLCGMGDGSVTQLPLSLPAKTILHLFLMNDGNLIDLQ